jgi:hypothetical protein
MEQLQNTNDGTIRGDEHRRRIERLLNFKERAGVGGTVPPVRIAQDALKKEYPDLTLEESQRIAREIMTAPKGKVVNIGDKREPITVEDLQFRIAQNIEFINSETDSMQQYFRWISKGDEVLRNMKDGHVSESDLRMKDEFLAPLDQREAELILCIALYSRSENALAPDRVRELTNKLAKLREYRSKVEATRSTADMSRADAARLRAQEKDRSMAERLLRIRAARAAFDARRRLEVLSGRRAGTQSVCGDRWTQRRAEFSKIIQQQKQNQR